MAKGKKIIILYQPPQKAVSHQPSAFDLHPGVYVFLGLVTIVAMASALAAVFH